LFAGRIKDDATPLGTRVRKQLILERLSLLTEVFAIDLYAYALMSNYYYLEVHFAVARAAT
jgi:hypothetical protein